MKKKTLKGYILMRVEVFYGETKKQGKLLFVWFHHPTFAPLTANERKRVKRICDRLSDLLEEYSLDFVFSGKDPGLAGSQFKTYNQNVVPEIIYKWLDRYAEKSTRKRKIYAGDQRKVQNYQRCDFVGERDDWW